MAERPMMTEARADFTCWLVSDTSSWKQRREENKAKVSESELAPREKLNSQSCCGCCCCRRLQLHNNNNKHEDKV